MRVIIFARILSLYDTNMLYACIYFTILNVPSIFTLKYDGNGDVAGHILQMINVSSKVKSFEVEVI